MKRREIEDLYTTTNSTVYRRLKWKRLANKLCSCTLCSPNKGCNRRDRRKREVARNWKSYRKNQWK